QHASLHRFCNSFFNRWHIFTRDNSTDNFVFKFKACTFFIRLKLDPYMSVLSTSTGLTDKFTFDFGFGAERFSEIGGASCRERGEDADLELAVGAGHTTELLAGEGV